VTSEKTITITVAKTVPSQVNTLQDERPETILVPTGQQIEQTRIASPEREQAAVAAPVEPPANPAQFIPMFKGAAEMEARRRVRMLAQRNPGRVAILRPEPVANLNPELSSSSSSTDMMADDVADSSDELASAVGESLDDEFDP
jgi:hypothetical protein